VVAQGGDRRVVEDPARLPVAPVQLEARASTSGTLLDLDGRLIGALAIELGSGRLKKDDPLDHRVGIVLHKQIGERVEPGEPLFTVHAANEGAAETARRRLAATCDIGVGTPHPTLVEEEVFGEGRAAFNLSTGG
jgi:thymidine phosphorylase